MKNDALHQAMIRLAYAERSARSALTAQACERKALIELTEAARLVRQMYMALLEGDDKELRTRPPAAG